MNTCARIKNRIDPVTKMLVVSEGVEIRGEQIFDRDGVQIAPDQIEWIDCKAGSFLGENYYGPKSRRAAEDMLGIGISADALGAAKCLVQ